MALGVVLVVVGIGGRWEGWTTTVIGRVDHHFDILNNYW